MFRKEKEEGFLNKMFTPTLSEKCSSKKRGEVESLKNNRLYLAEMTTSLLACESSNEIFCSINGFGREHASAQFI